MIKHLFKTMSAIALLSTGQLHAQQQVTITTIGVFGDDSAHELIDEGQPKRHRDQMIAHYTHDITPFGINTTSPTAVGNKLVDQEILRLTRDRFEKANYTVDIIQQEKKKNILGISGGVINIDGLPTANPKKAAKSGTYQNVTAIDAKILFDTIAAPSFLTIDGVNYEMKYYFLLSMTIKISFYNKEGEVVEKKEAIVRGTKPLPRKTVVLTDEPVTIYLSGEKKAMKARKEAAEKGIDVMESGEGVPASMVIQLYEDALNKALGL